MLGHLDFLQPRIDEGLIAVQRIKGRPLEVFLLLFAQREFLNNAVVERAMWGSCYLVQAPQVFEIKVRMLSERCRS